MSFVFGLMIQIRWNLAFPIPPCHDIDRIQSNGLDEIWVSDEHIPVIVTARRWLRPSAAVHIDPRRFGSVRAARYRASSPPFWRRTKWESSLFWKFFVESCGPRNR
jgi:hypothetical protein